MTTNCTCPSEDQTSINRVRCTSALQRLQQQNICKGIYPKMTLITIIDIDSNNTNLQLFFSVNNLTRYRQLYSTIFIHFIIQIFSVPFQLRQDINYSRFHRQLKTFLFRNKSTTALCDSCFLRLRKYSYLHTYLLTYLLT